MSIKLFETSTKPCLQKVINKLIFFFLWNCKLSQISAHYKCLKNLVHSDRIKQ